MKRILADGMTARWHAAVHVTTVNPPYHIATSVPLASRLISARRRFAGWSLLFVLILLAGRTAGASPEWASGWTRCPLTSADWSHLAVSSDASTIAAIGWSTEGEVGELRRLFALSEDWGWTWRSLPMLPPLFPDWISHLAVSDDGSLVVVGGSSLLYDTKGEWTSQVVVVTSEDQGTTWTRRSLPRELAQLEDGSATLASLALSGDGREILVAVAGFAGLSRDRGATWGIIRRPENGRTELVAASADGTTLAVSGNDGQLWLTMDSGLTWNRRQFHHSPSSHYFSRIELGGDGQSIVAVPWEGPLQLSDDQGQSWRHIDLPPHSGTLAISARRTDLLLALNENLWDGYGSPPLLFFSPDSGATWRTAELGWIRLVAMSANGTVQVAATDSRAILINGVLHPPRVLDIHREGDLGLVGNRSVTMGVEATGGQLNYQWMKDGTSLTERAGLSHTRSVELRLTSVTEADLGTYSVIVSNAVGSIEQEVLTLKLDPPAVSAVNRSGSAALVDGAAVAFRVEATGGLLAYQWQRNGEDLQDGPGRTGSYTPELRLAAATVADLGTYSLIISNSKGMVITNVGELKLTRPRVVATEPAAQTTVVRGDPVHLQVQLEGGQIEVEWLFNGLSLGPSGTWVGPGTNVLVLTNVQSFAAGQYGVRLRNSVGETVAEVARLTESSWSRAFVPVAAWNAVAMSATGDRIVACAPDRVFASKDRGNTWERWPIPGTDWTSVALGHIAGSVILGQGRSAYDPAQPTFGYQSTDFGNSWMPWNQDVNDVDWRTTSVACSADGQTVLLSQEIPAWGPFGLPIQWSYLRFSRDGGQTWQTDSSDVFIAYRMGSVTCSDDGRSMAAIRHDFFAGSSIKFSRDAGLTWRATALPDPFIRTVRISPDGGRLVALAGQNLYACKSSSLVWERLPATAANWTVVALSQDGQRIFAADLGPAFEGGVIHQSDDGGQTWRWSGSPSANWTAMACSADGERVVGLSNQGIFLAPAAASSLVSAVPIQAASDASGVHFVWQGVPHRTYRLTSTASLDGRPWRSAGAVVADQDGRVFHTEPAVGPQRFWQALGSEE